MAVPFRRTSKAKKGMRRSHQALTAPNMVVCSNCGYYKGKLVVAPKKDAKAE